MPTTLTEALQARVAENRNSTAFTYLMDGETEGPRLTYGELDAHAKSVGRAVRHVAGDEDRALLVYPPGLDFITAFFGCLYAGVTAVPVYPPRPDFLRPGPQPLVHFAADCRPSVVLSDSETLAGLRPWLSHESLAQARVIATDQLEQSSGDNWALPKIMRESVALLQYTSGSTTEPRGVMVSQANLLHNEQMIKGAFNHRGPGIGISWLPPYHDMGLIGCILQPVFHGASSVMMSPIRFLQQPLRWLSAISKYRGYTSVGPPLAYDLCVERISSEQKKALDLTGWAIAAIGSEPVRAQTMGRFSDAFAECGFRPEAFYPCYGLAEATLFVTGGRDIDPPRLQPVDRAALREGMCVVADPSAANTTTLVGCGHVWGGQRLAIVDPEARVELPPGNVGEIWLAGPSVAKGYWNRPQLTQEFFQARLANGEGPMLRTGDLGFVMDGELFITGRLKDIIILYGRNHAPQDIEETVQSVHPALRAGCGAAFETERNEKPLLVVVQEVDRRTKSLDPTTLIGQVRQAVGERHEVRLGDLVLVQPGSIPKTSSGKVQRQACRRAYENDGLRRWKGATK